MLDSAPQRAAPPRVGVEQSPQTIPRRRYSFCNVKFLHDRECEVVIGSANDKVASRRPLASALSNAAPPRISAPTLPFLGPQRSTSLEKIESLTMLRLCVTKDAAGGGGALSLGHQAGRDVRMF